MALVTMSCLFKRFKVTPHIVSSNGLISSFWTRQFKTVSSLRNVPSRMGGYFNVSERGMVKLKIRDNIPDNYTLIYNAPMETVIKIVYPAIAFCTIAATAFVLVNCYGNPIHMLFTESNSNVTYSNLSNEVLFFLGAIVIIAASGFAVIFKFPFRVYKHNSKKEYIALFLSCIPGKLRHYHFEKASLTKFKNPLYFFMDNCHYVIDNKKAFLLSHFFRKPVDLSELEGSR